MSDSFNLSVTEKLPTLTCEESSKIGELIWDLVNSIEFDHDSPAAASTNRTRSRQACNSKGFDKIADSPMWAKKKIKELILTKLDTLKQGSKNLREYTNEVENLIYKLRSTGRKDTYKIRDRKWQTRLKLLAVCLQSFLLCAI